MSNLESEKGFLIWVSHHWQLPPIEKVEDIGGSSMKIRRLQFVDGKIRFIKRMDSKDTIQRGLSIHDVHSNMAFESQSCSKRRKVNGGQIKMGSYMCFPMS